MRPFKKSELIGVTLILSVVFLVTFSNLRIAQRRSRDSTRKQDLGAISDALHKYYADFGFFPRSEDGKIIACKNEKFDAVVSELIVKKDVDRNKLSQGLRGCIWGKDTFTDVLDSSYPPYLNLLPQDPKTGENIQYYYISNSIRFQLYAYLEGEENEDGYNESIVQRKLSCGIKDCSYGKSFQDTPLNRSIEEYEEELYERLKSGNNR